MPIRFYLWLSFLWLGMIILFNLVNFNFATSGTITATANADIDTLFLMNQFSTFTIPIIDIGLPIPHPSLFSTLAKMLIWEYPFFAGHWNLVRIFFLLPITFAATFVFIQALAPVITSIVSAVGDFIGRLINIF